MSGGGGCSAEEEEGDGGGGGGGGGRGGTGDWRRGGRDGGAGLKAYESSTCAEEWQPSRSRGPNLQV